MKLLKTLSDINTDTVEGKYLMAAMAILTTQPSLVLFGKQKQGTKMTPDEMLQKISELKKRNV